MGSDLSFNCHFISPFSDYATGGHGIDVWSAYLGAPPCAYPEAGSPPRGSPTRAGRGTGTPGPRRPLPEGWGASRAGHPAPRPRHVVPLAGGAAAEAASGPGSPPASPDVRRPQQAEVRTAVGGSHGLRIPADQEAQSILLSSGPASPCSTPPMSPTSRPTSTLTSDWLDALVQDQVAAGAFQAAPGEAEARRPAALASGPQARQRMPDPAPGPSSQATGRAVGAALAPRPAADGWGGLQPAATITLTAAQARWVPRWFLRGLALSPDSAIPSWMNAVDGSTTSAALLLRSASDLGSARAGSWRRSFGPPLPYRHAEVLLPEHDDAGTGSGSRSPDMLSARSGASWLLPASPSRANSTSGVCDLSDGSSGHLDLSSLSSASSAHGDDAGSLKRSSSSGSVSSLTSLSSIRSAPREDLADFVEAATSESVWPFWAQLEEQGDASSAPSRQGGSRSRSPSPDRLGLGDRSNRSREAAPAPVSSFPDHPQVEPADLPVDAVYKAAELAITHDMDSYGSFRSRYTELKEAMGRTGGVQADRLAGLLGREEEAIRSHCGRTRLQSLMIDLDVNPGWDAEKRSARNAQLKWIKQERALLGSSSPAASGGLDSSHAGTGTDSRTGPWARSHLVPARQGQGGRAASTGAWR